MKTSANEKMREALIKLRDQARTNIRARGADVVGAGWVIDVCEAALSTVHTQEVSGEAMSVRDAAAYFIDVLDDYHNNPPESRCYVDDAYDDAIKAMRSALQSQAGTPPAEREGWKLVPVEPTGPMLEAGRELHPTLNPMPHTIYKAMLAAAPNAPQQQGQEGWVAISDRLPPVETPVFLLNENRWMNTGSDDLNVNWMAAGWLLDFGGHHWSVIGETRGMTIDSVTHWKFAVSPQQQEQSGEENGMDLLLHNLRTIGTHHCDQTVGEEAAQEIERLRKELRKCATTDGTKN